MIKKCFVVPALLALLCLSCADNIVQETSEPVLGDSHVLPPSKKEIPLVEMTFTASMPGSESRSVMGGGATNGTHPLFWSVDDKIGVIGKKTGDEGEIDCVHKFTLKEGAGTSFGKFEGEADTQDEYHIIHPYQGWVTYDTGNSKTMHMVVPAIQTAKANTYDPNVVLMVGNADDLDKDVTFKNVVSFLRIKPKYDCKSITIQTNSDADRLTGTVDVSYNDGVPTWTPSTLSGDHVEGNPTATSNKVTLRGNIVHDTYYYIAVLPGTISSGFTVIVETCDQIGAYKTTQAATMLRSKYHDFTGFPTTVIEEYVDLGLSVKWANRNLGALMPYDTGNYYAWGEIGAMGEDDPDNEMLATNYKTTTKFYYNWESYKLGDGSDIGDDNPHMKKYKDESLKQLLDEDDAAYMSECGRRMPTKGEFEELLANCYWVYTEDYKSSTKKGFIVYKRKDGDITEKTIANYKTNSSSVVYSTSDTHIFLPFTGFYQDKNTINNNTTHGYYWCRDVYDQLNPGKSECYYEKAYDLLLGNDKGGSNEYAEMHPDNRRGGQCIRPVMAK
ncbi:MAG: hypothetical protein KBT34_11795 [Prevotella sp.]|nr:hypothetical protein [Candidatus Prevotella equi]